MTTMLTVKQLAEKLNVPASTIYTWVSESRVPYVRLPNGLRFNAGAIDAWVKARTVSAKPIGSL